MILHNADRPSPEDADEWVQVENYSNRILAELDKTRLSESGIDSKIYDEIMGSFYANAVGGIRLMVQSAQLQIAKTVLESEQAAGTESFDAGSEITPTTLYCFRCHSKNVRRAPLGGHIGTRMFFKLFGFRESAHCLDCQNDWKV